MTSAPRPVSKFPLPLERVAGGGARTGAAPARSVLRPQVLVQQAAADAARRVVPSGLGLDSVEIRRRMVQRLQAKGLTAPGVIAALMAVARDRFVDSALVNQAYEDTSLPIGHGQTISKPSVVAHMIELLSQGAAARENASLGRVLEIGTGCGYQAAVLAQLAREVFSIERVRALHDKARVHLNALRETRVRLVYGDGRLGHAPNAPYRSIIAAAGGESLPQAWLDQLEVGGRLVAPVRSADGRQQLVVVDRGEQGLQRSLHDAVLFVPLKAGLD
ncbi:MAG: protein-L-isoaspartate(D-aspartate) O-methyltransferase [Rhizobacter sp.]|nr:protein-L-isoaspartate(D-aspartate) O-methyltransferase [Rhizobacter sp.]